MDPPTVEFLTRKLQGGLKRVEQSLPPTPEGWGKQLVNLVRAFVKGIDDEGNRIATAAPTSTPEERKVYARRLLILQANLALFYEEVAPYLEQIGRHDLPIGLTHLIDALISDLLSGEADPVLRLSPATNYSVLSFLQPSLRSAMKRLGVTFVEDPRPVAFTVPALDPTNALLSPILAHEVGHIVVDDYGLVAELETVVDQQPVDDARRAELKREGISDPTQWNTTWARWQEELLCDAVATLMLGPSFLFASAAFLSAPGLDVLGSHPFPRDRVRITLQQIEVAGWLPLLEARVPKLIKWLTEVTAPPPPPPGPTSPLEKFLRVSMAEVEGSLLAVVGERLTPSFRREEFDQMVDRLLEMLDAGVPPAQLDSHPVSPWAMVLAAWLQAFEQWGDSPETLARATDDATFNRFVMKGVEMAGVLRVWGQS